MPDNGADIYFSGTMAGDDVSRGPDVHLTEPSAATVVISRTDETDIRQRQIYAQIDAGRSHTLIFGDTVTIDVAPGSHELRVNNTLFWKKVPFSVESGERVEFALINRSGKFAFGFLALLGVAPLTLSIERR